MVTARSALRRWATGSGTDWAHSASASSRWWTQSARWASSRVRKRAVVSRLADMRNSLRQRGKTRAPEWWRVRRGLLRLGGESGELRRGPVLAAAEDVESSQAACAPVEIQREHHAARESGLFGRGPGYPGARWEGGTAPGRRSAHR